MKYTETEKKSLIKSGVKDFKISYEQSEKRVNKLLAAIDNGMFEGIPNTGPEDIFQYMFVQVKIEQYMTTPVL